ncbi:MAG: hypothetical protein AAGC56_07155 [Pseudomonadota bacterium]
MAITPRVLLTTAAYVVLWTLVNYIDLWSTELALSTGVGREINPALAQDGGAAFDRAKGVKLKSAFTIALSLCFLAGAAFANAIVADVDPHFVRRAFKLNYIRFWTRDNRYTALLQLFYASLISLGIIAVVAASNCVILLGGPGLSNLVYENVPAGLSEPQRYGVLAGLTIVVAAVPSVFALRPALRWIAASPAAR